MLRRDTQAIMQKFSVIVIVSSLAIGAVICAPQQQQQQQQQQMQSNSVSSSQHQTSASAVNHYNPQRQQVASSTSTTPSEQSAASIAPAASVASGQPSIVPTPTYSSETSSSNNNNNDASADAQSESSSSSSSDAKSSSPQSALDNSEASELDIFDGKSPFTDDSLWQIPFQMVGDGLTSADEKSGEQMANSASETSSLNDNDGEDEEQAQSAPIPNQPSAALLATAEGNLQPIEPAIESIVADDAAAVSSAPAKSSDLKTAAGYHYPTHGGHGGHHYPASGHHGGADYHGGHGYFQYVDVPKPNAYDYGYRRGNSKHTIERYEKKHGPHFTTKVKWSDKHGHGVHTWDYNHDDHHKGYNHYDDDHHGGHHGGGGGDYHHQKKYAPKKYY